MITHEAQHNSDADKRYELNMTELNYLFDLEIDTDKINARIDLLADEILEYEETNFPIEYQELIGTEETEL